MARKTTTNKRRLGVAGHGLVKAHQAQVAWKTLTGPWSSWATLVNRLRDWMVSPEPEPIPEAPDVPVHIGSAADELAYEHAKGDFEREVKQRRVAHVETSKTIRWIFRTLIGVCLFCVITLAGSPDVQLLVPDAMVKMPIINYELSFVVFLVIGPVIVLGLTVYLQIFVAHHRQWPVQLEDKVPFIFNMRGVAPNLITSFLFYWLVPLTLAFFTWKALPRPLEGSVLFVGTLAVAAGLVWLQIRRCPLEWRAWAVPLLLVALGGLLALGTYSAVAGPPINRALNLFKADLAGKDLRNLNLAQAFLQEAKLEKASFNRANLSGADLSRATLTEADLSNANLQSANFLGASLVNANLTLANLERASFLSSDISGANLDGANLRGAKFASDLIRPSNALGNAFLLFRLRGVRGAATGLSQEQLNQACGDDTTILPPGFSIGTCLDHTRPVGFRIADPKLPDSGRPR